ncbi:MAG TPA: PEP-CTERM sorting domain-containing protein, partial [Phycisphaerae bacterium]|nr:PEP-CTERM sorting domain-containing protein [Phycisphaerae bacterium]
VANPDLEVRLLNVRTFSDIPADLLNLQDINESLDTSALLPFEAAAYSEIGPLPWSIDSFFDVFVKLTIPENVSPDFESLLIADVVVLDPDGNQTSVGRFWNLNPQSPEPGTVTLLAVGACVAMLRRRK